MLFNKPIFLSLVLVFALHLPVSAQQIPSPQQALQNFGIGPTQLEQLERGEIVSYEVSETSKKELGIGLAMIIPVALPKIVDYIRKGNLAITENDLITTGPLFADSDLSSFQKFGFNNTQIDEAKTFLNAKPGDSFNLSKQELDSLKSFQTSLEDIERETLIKTANQKYREFLLQRFTAYRKNGLSGIAAYSRAEGIADPAEELRTDAINSKAWSQYFPELQQAWLNYPAPLPANTNEQFLWLNRRVEDRPTAILAHRLIATSDTLAAFSYRGNFMWDTPITPAM